MVRLLICYPAADGSFFDHDYYRDTHLPLSEELLAPFGFLGYTVHRGESTVRGGPPPMLCITELEFESLEGLQQGMARCGAELSADFANYTDITPVATVCSSD